MRHLNDLGEGQAERNNAVMRILRLAQSSFTIANYALRVDTNHMAFVLEIFYIPRYLLLPVAVIRRLYLKPGRVTTKGTKEAQDS